MRMATSMLPLAALGLVIVAACFAHVPRRPLGTLMAAFLIAGVAAAPSFAVSDRPEASAAALSFVESHWNPPRPR